MAKFGEGGAVALIAFHDATWSRRGML